MKFTLGSLLILAPVAAACGGSTSPAETAASTPASSAVPSPTIQAASQAPLALGTVEAPVPAKPPEPPAPTAVVKFAGPFQTPESVLWDEAADRYLVSNINGKPFEADNNGFISELSPDGKTIKEKWIAGGENKVTLNAPKGMALAKGVLYVADIDTVRMFDPKTGASKGDVKVAGATFLNDVAAGPDGKIYFTDSGMKGGEKGLEPTGTDAVYVLEKGKPVALGKGTDLGRPNGVFIHGKDVWINTFGTGEVYRLDAKGQRQDVMKPPKGGLDGLGMFGEWLFVSSWEGGAVYKAKFGGTFEPVLTGLKSPADFAIDRKRSRIVVPWFLENRVEAYEVK